VATVSVVSRMGIGNKVLVQAQVVYSAETSVVATIGSKIGLASIDVIIPTVLTNNSLSVSAAIDGTGLKAISNADGTTITTITGTVQFLAIGN